MEASPEAFISPLNPKHDDSQQVLQILQALKQASHELHQNPNPNPNSNSNSAIKALLELQHDSHSILNDPQLSTLSTHLTSLKSLIHKSSNSRQRHRGIKSFVIRRIDSHEVSKLAGSIESEIQAWIDREFVENLTRTLTTGLETKQEVLIDVIERFELRIGAGFDRELQDLVIRSKVFTKLEAILCDCGFSNQVRETAAFAIAELIRFNKDVFVGQVLMSNTVGALISLASVPSIRILCLLIKSIRSPLVDELVSNGEIPKIIGFLTSEDLLIQTMALDCVLEIGYFGRKEAIDAMLEEDLVKKLVELQKSEPGGALVDTRTAAASANHNNDIERHPFTSCVARFAVQIEVGEGLRQREKRALKQEVLKRVREAHVSEAEAATIIAEVLWGASP